MKETKTYKKLKSKKQDNFPEMIILHHSGGTDANPLADTSSHTADMIEQWHMAKGWEGIGYTYVIEKDGTIAKGRPETYHGAHTVNYNSKSIGICMSGNFDATYPTKAQEESFKTLYKDISKRYKNLKVYPHRKFANKTCFGKKLKDDYGQKLADVSMIQPEIKDDTKEALAFCKAENARYQTLFGKLKSIF